MSNITPEQKKGLIAEVMRFGASEQAARVYLALVQYGPQGIVSLTKLSGYGRNVVYRLVEELSVLQLISILEKSWGKEYAAHSSNAFEAIIARKEAEAADLRLSLESTVAALTTLGAGNSTPSKVVHFEGLNGLKQVNWNLTKAEGEFRVYEQSHLDEYLDIAFVQKFRRRIMARKLITYDLKNKKTVKGYDDSQYQEYARVHSKMRYIDPTILEIQFEMYIYNNVVTLLDYVSDQPHCVEIHNMRLAQMQKQIYDAVWSQAQELVFDEETGGRKLPT